MLTTFTNEERQYIRNMLCVTLQDGSKLDSERLICNDIFNTLRGGNADITSDQVTYLQCMIQEQSEIWGRTSSTANEKSPVALHEFVPQKLRKMLQSIGTKIGATIKLDTETRNHVLSPRSEGSAWIMTDVTKNHIG